TCNTRAPRPPSCRGGERGAYSSISLHAIYDIRAVTSRTSKRFLGLHSVERHRGTVHPGCPPGRVHQHLGDVGMAVRGRGLVAGTEVEDLALAPVIAAAAAKDRPALEPA